MEKLKDYIQEKLNDVFNKTPEEQNRVKHLISKMGDFYIRGTKVIDANLHAEWGKAIISSSELYCLKELEDALQIMEILYSGKVRTSAGYGISWNSPIGAINLSWAYPITYEEYDERQRFRFSIGTGF